MTDRKTQPRLHPSEYQQLNPGEDLQYTVPGHASSVVEMGPTHAMALRKGFPTLQWVWWWIELECQDA